MLDLEFLGLLKEGVAHSQGVHQLKPTTEGEKRGFEEENNAQAADCHGENELKRS